LDVRAAGMGRSGLLGPMSAWKCNRIACDCRREGVVGTAGLICTASTPRSASSLAWPSRVVVIL
jgi:hypothetical protein